MYRALKRSARNGVEICKFRANRCKEGRSCLMGATLTYFCAGRPVLKVKNALLRHAMQSCMASCYSSASTCAAAPMYLVHHRLLFTASCMFGAREVTECFRSAPQVRRHCFSLHCVHCTDFWLEMWMVLPAATHVWPWALLWFVLDGIPPWCWISRV